MERSFTCWIFHAGQCWIIRSDRIFQHKASLSGSAIDGNHHIQPIDNVLIYNLLMMVTLQYGQLPEVPTDNVAVYSGLLLAVECCVPSVRFLGVDDQPRNSHGFFLEIPSSFCNSTHPIQNFWDSVIFSPGNMWLQDLKFKVKKTAKHVSTPLIFVLTPPNWFTSVNHWKIIFFICFPLSL